MAPNTLAEYDHQQQNRIRGLGGESDGPGIPCGTDHQQQILKAQIRDQLCRNVANIRSTPSLLEHRWQMDEDDQRETLLSGESGHVKAEHRSTKDLVFALIFLVVIVGYLSMASQEAITGYPSRLHHGVDRDGNFCGTRNKIRDLRTANYLYIGNKNQPKQSAVCVDECPKPDFKSPMFGNTTDSYVCWYKFRDETLEQIKAHLNDDCWLAYPTRGYMHACHSTNPANPVTPYVISGARGNYGDVYFIRARALLFGLLLPAVLALLFVYTLRSNPKLTVIATGFLLHMCLLGLAFLADLNGEELERAAKKQTPILSPELKLANSMGTISYVLIGLLVAAFVGCMLLRKDLIAGYTAISESRPTAPGMMFLIPISTISIMCLVTWLTFTAIPSIASKAMKLGIQPTNSYLEMDGETTFKIAYVGVCYIWLLAFLVYASYFMAVAAGCAFIFSPKDQRSASASDGFSAFVPFHIGSVVVASVYLLPLEIPYLLVSRVISPIYWLLPAGSPAVLAQAAFTGDSLLGAARSHGRIARALPSYQRVLFGINSVFALGHSTVASVCVLFAWPSIVHAADGDAAITSVALPLFVTWVLAEFVSRAVCTIVSGPTDATVQCCAADIANDRKGNIRFSEVLVDMVGAGAMLQTPSVSERHIEEDDDAPKSRDAAPVVEVEMGGGSHPEAKSEAAEVQARAEEGINKAEEQMNALMSKMGLDVKKDDQ